MDGVSDRGQGIREAAIVFLVVSILATALRFCGRAVASGKRFWWDDWLILVDLPFVIVLCALTTQWHALGLGLHLWDVPRAHVRELRIQLWVAEILFDVSISVAKISVVLFYTRIFTITRRRYRAALWLGGILNVAWLIYSIMVRVFECIPLHKLWDAEVHGHCSSHFALFLANAATALVVDLYVLLLPMPMLWGLQMDLRRKLLVSAVLLVGYSVIVITIARLVTVILVGSHLDEDTTWNIVPVQWCYLLEAPISLVGACLPPIYHLFRHAQANNPTYTLSFFIPGRAAAYRQHQQGKEARSSSNQDSKSARSGLSRAGDFSRLLDVEPGGRDFAQAGVRHAVKATGGDEEERGSGVLAVEEEIVLDQINVRRDISVTEENVWRGGDAARTL